MIILEMIVYVTIGSIAVRFIGEIGSGILESFDDVNYPGWLLQLAIILDGFL